MWNQSIWNYYKSEAFSATHNYCAYDREKRESNYNLRNVLFVHIGVNYYTKAR